MSELPPLTSDYYQFLGIERRLSLDTEELQRVFYALSRRLHPDRFTLKSPAERQHSLDATALLNDAYRVLRDPIQRAEYVLKTAGLDVAEQRTKDVPPELLEEVFELNMALEEARSGDESARPQLEEARRRFMQMRADIDSRLEQTFLDYDANPSSQALGTIRGILNRRRYISNLVREVDAALSPSAVSA